MNRDLKFNNITSLNQYLLIFLKKGWINNFSWDFFWIFSGFWLIPIIMILDNLELFYVFGVFLFWISHRISSVFIAWTCYAYRPLIFKQWFRFLCLPLLTFTLILMWFFLPKSLLPLNMNERFIIIAFLDYFWGIYHFSIQHFGFLRLYRFKNKIEEQIIESKLDKFYCLMVGGLIIILIEFIKTNQIYRNQNYFTFIVDFFRFDLSY